MIVVSQGFFTAVFCVNATIIQIHGSSTNARRKPRLGVFSRWHHADMYLPQPVEPPDFEVCQVALLNPFLQQSTPQVMCDAIAIVDAATG